MWQIEIKAQILPSNTREGWKKEKAYRAEETKHCEDVTAFQINSRLDAILN